MPNMSIEKHGPWSFSHRVTILRGDLPNSRKVRLNKEERTGMWMLGVTRGGVVEVTFLTPLLMYTMRVRRRRRGRRKGMLLLNWPKSAKSMAKTVSLPININKMVLGSTRVHITTSYATIFKKINMKVLVLR